MTMNWWSRKPPDLTKPGKNSCSSLFNSSFFCQLCNIRRTDSWDVTRALTADHGVSVPILTASLACMYSLLMIPSAAPLPEPASVNDGSSVKWLVNSVLVLVCDALCGTFNFSAGFILYFAELESLGLFFPIMYRDNSIINAITCVW